MEEFIDLLEEYVSADRDYCYLYEQVSWVQQQNIKKQLDKAQENLLDFVKKLIDKANQK